MKKTKMEEEGQSNGSKQGSGFQGIAVYLLYFNILGHTLEISVDGNVISSQRGSKESDREESQLEVDAARRPEGRRSRGKLNFRIA